VDVKDHREEQDDARRPQCRSLRKSIYFT
jgi:hypothetical protein